MSRYKVTIEVESASGPQAEVFIKHFLRDTDSKVIKATKICSPKPRRKWFVYIDWKIDMNSLGGLTKTRAKGWVRDYKKGFKRPAVFTITDTLMK
jgi:hypothetical protein